MNNKGNNQRSDKGPRIFGFYRSVGKPSIAKQLEKLEYQQCSHIYNKWAHFKRAFPRKGDVLYVWDMDILHRNLKGIQECIKFLNNKEVELRILRPDVSPFPPMKYSRPVLEAFARARAKAGKKQTENANEANRKRDYPLKMDRDQFQAIFTDFLAYVRGEAKGSLKDRLKRLNIGGKSYYDYLERYILNMQNGIWEYPQKIHEDVLNDILSRRSIEHDPKTKKWIKVKL